MNTSALKAHQDGLTGIHLLAELHGCDGAQPLMRSCAAVEQLLLGACAAAGLTAVGTRFHQFGAPDAAAGVTGVVLLEESHVCIHTWPELGCVTLDVYVCNFSRDNSRAARACLRSLVDAYAPGTAHTREVARDLPHIPAQVSNPS
jgi:S-adenosylmethionine decarboxylase proenzyme